MATKLIDYVDYDFDRLVTQLTNRLKATDTWKDTYRSSTGQMLIELYAYIGNLVLYYIERRAEESYLETAQLRSSVINLVRLINYNPKRKVSAIGVLKFTIDATRAYKVYIPQYTECKTSAGAKYLVSEDAVILVGATNVTVSGIQGQLINITLSSSGTANQEYQIADDSVENTNLFVYVDGEIWTEVSSFTSSTSTSKEYRVRSELDGTITVLFGDDVFGKSPALGSTILLKYIKSTGVNGNVYETDKITSITGTIYDGNDVAVTDITVTNEDVFIGGDDAEDIETIRSEAPKVFKTGDRAVTKTDFISIIENYAGVANANVWGENEETPPNYNLFNTLKICLLMENWAYPSAAFKQVLSEYLYTKSMLTVKYEYTPAIILYVVPTMTVRINRGFTKSQSETNISSTLAGRFLLGTTTLLGRSKRISDLISYVENLSEVSYVHMHLEIRKELVSYYDSYYLYGEMLQALPAVSNSVSIYVGATDTTAILIAHTDIDGNFVPDDSSYWIGGTVNLTTGYIGIDATVPSGEFIWVRYQQDNSALNSQGDVVVDQDQVCQMYNDEADITEIKYVDEA